MRFLIVVLVTMSSLSDAATGAERPSLHDWEKWTPREEIRPVFDRNSSVESAPQQLSIAADDRAGLAGAWVCETAVQGSRWYRFSVTRKTDGMHHPRRGAVARLIWLGENDKPVLRPDPTFTSYRRGERPRAEPEFPMVQDVQGESQLLTGTYQAPPQAIRIRIELHFRWGEPHSSVQWIRPQLEMVEQPSARKVRLATVHHQPRDGTTAAEKREQFEPLIAMAAEQQADLVVLPETLTYYRSKRSFAEVAEPIPGPSTNYFADLAKRNDLYIVAGLVERDQHLIYNVAVLLGPDGEIVGKYRKTTLPRSEIEAGLTPGNSCPVFPTRFGKVGLMICYDGFFPEVARELANQGAEVIAWPVWGCNPLLASARACENHVFVVSSTYSDTQSQWMRSAIFGRDGKIISGAEDFGTIAIADVELGRPLYWHSLGDFQAQIQPHRPVLRDSSP